MSNIPGGTFIPDPRGAADNPKASVELLLQSNADVDAKNEHGRTALMLAAQDKG